MLCLQLKDDVYSIVVCSRQALTSFFQGSLQVCNSWSQRACSLNRMFHPAFSPLKHYWYLSEEFMLILKIFTRNCYVKCFCHVNCRTAHLLRLADQTELLGVTELGQLLPRSGHQEVAMHFLDFD